MDEYLDEDLSLEEFHRRFIPHCYRLEDYEVNSLRDIEYNLSKDLTRSELINLTNYLEHLAEKLANFIVTGEKEGVDCGHLRSDFNYIKRLLERLETKLAMNKGFLKGM